MNSKLDLDPGMIASCQAAAAQIAEQVGEEIAGKTTVSVQRTLARLLGVDGVNELDAPLPNVLVDHVADRGELGGALATGSAMRCSTTSVAHPSRSRRTSTRGDWTCARCRARRTIRSGRESRRSASGASPRSLRARASAMSCERDWARAHHRCVTC